MTKFGYKEILARQRFKENVLIPVLVQRTLQCCKTHTLMLVLEVKTSAAVYPQQSLSVRVKQGFRPELWGMHLTKVAAASLLAGPGCGSRWPVSTHPAVWTFSRLGPRPGDAAKSYLQSSDFKIAPHVQRAVDNVTQRCALPFSEVCQQLLEEPQRRQKEVIVTEFICLN